MVCVKGHFVAHDKVALEDGSVLSVSFNSFRFTFYYKVWYFLLINDGKIIKAVGGYRM
jgi:hypothetical protein